MDVGTPGFFIGESWIITDRVHGLVRPESPMTWRNAVGSSEQLGCYPQVLRTRRYHGENPFCEMSTFTNYHTSMLYIYNYMYIYMDMYIYIIINNYIHIYRHYTYTHMLHDFYPCVKQLEYWWFSTPFICAGKWATAAVLLQARTHARSEAAVRLAAKGTRRPVGPWDRSTARRSSGLGVHGIDVLFPLVGWWK